MTDEERETLITAIEDVLWKIHDKDELYKIALVTGFTIEELKELGGL